MGAYDDLGIFCAVRTGQGLGRRSRRLGAGALWVYTLPLGVHASPVPAVDTRRCVEPLTRAAVAVCAQDLDTSQKQLITGYILHCRKVLYVCDDMISDECVARLGTLGWWVPTCGHVWLLEGSVHARSGEGNDGQASVAHTRAGSEGQACGL
mgnify:CR=1 FL=1